VNVESLKESLFRLPGVGLIVRAARRGRDDYIKDMAASVAFFSFFSLFPLLLGVIAIGSRFLDPAEIQARLDQLLLDALPGSADFVRRNLDTLIRLRGAVGVASVAALMWSASKMFGAVSRGVNRALGLERTHPFYFSPIRYFLLTLIVPLLLFLSVAVSTLVELMTRSGLDFLGVRFEGVLGAFSGHVTSYVVELVILAVLYSLVPYQKPSWPAIRDAALVAALLYEVCRALFVLYLENASRMEAVYGSVSSIIVLLLWLYVSARILLFGAELIAAREQPE
jgi:membrane protein